MKNQFLSENFFLQGLHCPTGIKVSWGSPPLVKLGFAITITVVSSSYALLKNTLRNATSPSSPRNSKIHLFDEHIVLLTGISLKLRLSVPLDWLHFADCKNRLNRSIAGKHMREVGTFGEWSKPQYIPWSTNCAIHSRIAKCWIWYVKETTRYTHW